FFLKEGGGSSDEAFFPRVDGAEFLCLFYVFMAFLECFVIRKIPKLLVQSHRSPPVGHGALRIARRGFGKRLFGFLVLEGVQESDTLFDGWLHFGSAGSGEIHFAKLIGWRRGQAGGGQHQEKNKQTDGSFGSVVIAHGGSSFARLRFYLQRPLLADRIFCNPGL